MWDLAPGFNLLTGETGAGKSILIDAISLLLGERADRGLIRTGSDSCAVEGELYFHGTERRRVVNSLLEEIGAESCDQGVLLLKRTITAAGAGRQFVNGSSVTLQALRQIGDLLVDVHGPHDHQSLLAQDKQTDLLDRYGKLQERCEAYGAAYKDLKVLEAELANLKENATALAERRERLTAEVQEIQGARLKPNEDETLENEYRAATNVEQLLGHAAAVIGTLAESDGAVLTQLAQVQKALTAWRRIDESVCEAEETSRRLISELQDLVGEVRRRSEAIEAEPERIREMEERLNVIHTLKRKYAGGGLAGLEQVIARGEKSAAELAKLEGEGGSVAQVEAKRLEQEEKVKALGAELTKARLAVAGPLSEKVTRELQVLGFKKALFEVGFTEFSGPAGCERVEFMFTPNAGESARPLRAIASSGEMARVMLALKTTLAEVDEVPILIFDEVDANVGGETATEVGKKLRGLGRGHQVLCITHLPQVASQGEHHFAVEKRIEKDRTITVLQKLEGAEREREIARMLGGQTEAALALARTLLKG